MPSGAKIRAANASAQPIFKRNVRFFLKNAKTDKKNNNATTSEPDPLISRSHHVNSSGFISFIFSSERQ